MRNVQSRLRWVDAALSTEARRDAPLLPVRPLPSAAAVMSQQLSPLAGAPVPRHLLLDVSRLIADYFALYPDASLPTQRVAFGTSGHRGSASAISFNEAHVLAITQAICDLRRQQGTTGPMFVGLDTHALSRPAFDSVLEVLAANSVETRIAAGDEYTPTPVISHAVLCHNRGSDGHAAADGIVITPSHNPPESGGIKYNAPHGGPAEDALTARIEVDANRYLLAQLAGVRRMPLARARAADCVRQHDFLTAYVNDLGNVIDLQAISGSGLRLGVDPLGGAGVHYWARIAERHHLDLDIVSTTVDPTFAFMTLDWDGRIRMDPSSPHAIRRLLALGDRYQVAFASDPDHDRFGIVTASRGLMPANHFLSVAIDYLFRHRPLWSSNLAVGKTLVSTSMIDRVCARLPQRVFEVPVGFKWFVSGLADGTLGFCGEESAGASLLRHDGGVWTTDKDGIALGLLAAEMTACTGRDPGLRHDDLEAELGAVYAERADAPATLAQKRALSKLNAASFHCDALAGDRIDSVLDKAPGNGAPLGGIKISTCNGWFAARPSGTEDLYKIYAESFRDPAHLNLLLEDAQGIVDAALARVE